MTDPELPIDPVDRMVPLLDKGPAEVLRALTSGDPAAVTEALDFQRESFRAKLGCYPEGMVEVCPECSDARCPLWLPLRAEIAGDDVDLATMARLNLRDDHRVAEPSCTVCGGAACDMFFCYVTEK